MPTTTVKTVISHDHYIGDIIASKEQRDWMAQIESVTVEGVKSTPYYNVRVLAGRYKGDEALISVLTLDIGYVDEPYYLAFRLPHIGS